MAHLPPLAPSSTDVERNLIASPSPTHAISMQLVCMARFVAPVASVLLLIAVLVELWMARLVLRAVSGVRGVFMACSLPSSHQKTYSNYFKELL